ncbi:MAG TPA: inositol-3-phosphate synthase [Acidimicrobiia bacterium]|jgi:myo-inositol-1-phosphate synthase
MPAELGILTPGLGAVSTTLIAGVELAKQGAPAVGSLSQLGQIDGRPVKDLVPVPALADVAFGAWDPYRDNGYEAATKAEVLSPAHLEAARAALESVVPMTAVFDREWVRNLEGTNNAKSEATKMELADAIADDIAAFQAKRKVMVWCGSTEVYRPAGEVHASLADFERGLKESHPDIAPSQIYAYAALRSGVPYVNGAPNVTVDTPALLELAHQTGTPVAGKDYKTGQTLMKTIIAPGIRDRVLGLRGWFSSNILGNRDGLVLDDPESFRSKEVSKLGVLDQLLKPDSQPELYGDITHQVRINYYPPAGDAKEGWDNIDLFGWLGYPMQIKVDFLCRDSILAAPLALDLALFMDLAARAGKSGAQEWLSFYFKSPQTEGSEPIHDLFEQRRMLDAALLEIAATL